MNVYKRINVLVFLVLVIFHDGRKYNVVFVRHIHVLYTFLGLCLMDVASVEPLFYSAASGSFVNIIVRYEALYKISGQTHKQESWPKRKVIMVEEISPV